MDSDLRAKLARLPQEPGVYLMKDARAAVLYVGKAKSLKNRVTSYFTLASGHHGKTKALVKQIHDVEIILTKTDVEALLLERTLIKHHQPSYNVLLRDDKNYPYLRVNFREQWPRLELVRQRQEDGAFYAGPFSSARFLRIMMDAAARVFPLIRCSSHEFAAAKRPCNYYHMKMCLGPCTLPVTQDVYHGMMHDAVEFIQGKNTVLIRSIKERMLKASEQENYELAAQYRDQLLAIEELGKKQTVVVQNLLDADAIGLAMSENFLVFYVLMVREGKLMGSDPFTLPNPLAGSPPTQEESAAESLAHEALLQFILQYYDGRRPPARILLQDHSADWPRFEELFAQSGEKAAIETPKRGTAKDILELAQRNADYGLQEAERKKQSQSAQLLAVQQRLHLKRLPRRMECIDISNMQGDSIVASCVCFIDGKPAKEHYRLYNVRTVSGANDDFASIREVVQRRLERGVSEDLLPDLLVVDGGKGQLSSALTALQEFKGLHVDIVSLAKSRLEDGKKNPPHLRSATLKRSFERVFVPGESTPLPLKVGSEEYRLLTQIRDEAHRFAISHHRRKRGHKALSSSLEEVPGVGPKTRQKLLQHFGSLDVLRQASLEELNAVPGISESVALRVYTSLKS